MCCLASQSLYLWYSSEFFVSPSTENTGFSVMLPPGAVTQSLTISKCGVIDRPNLH